MATSKAVKVFARIAVRGSLLVIGFYLVRAYIMLARIRTINEEDIFCHLIQQGKAIGVCWHQRIFGLFRYGKRLTRFKPALIVSASHDGDVLAYVLAKIGARPIRGSSSYRGKEAMNALVDDFTYNNFALHALDGPTGPIGQVKSGIIRIAQKTGVPIFPIYVAIDRAWRLKSWDRMLVPKPFAVITMYWGKPFYIPSDLSPQEFERWRQELETAVQKGQEEIDAMVGGNYRLFTP
ncbi:MAG: lysophospholipid acyltransferase family protein [Deltaproteobacteria bacterium]